MLLRKAARAIWANKQSYIACVFLIGIGIMMYLAMNAAGEGLDLAVRKFYREHSMADIFTKVEAMPTSAADILEDIEGIESADARYVLEARAEVPGSDEIITLRLISVDEDMRLNMLHVTGNMPSGENDILVNPTFFNAHGMSMGDSFSIFVDGREYTYSVCGTVISPEYIYITRGGTDMLPDETGFGIAYITSDSMSHLTNSAGIANDIILSLESGYTFDDVKIQLEDALTPYGLEQLLDKDDQLSYAYLKLEVESIRSMASALPMIFILMAAIVLYLMMKRVIEQDRTQIGTLKALGYSNTQILLHYLTYGGITGLAGGIWGSVAGYALSGFYLDMYLQFFIMPEMSFDPNYTYILGSFLLSVGGGVAGSFFGAYKILKLNPAEAMRPEGPKPVKHDIVGSIKFLKYILTSRGNMALRSITRNWMRSGFVVIGVMFSFGLLSLSGSFNGMIDKMILSQFEDIQLYGVKITLKQPLDYDSAVESAYAIDHVTRAEGFLEIPAELKNKHLSEGIMLTGVDQNSSLYRITDTNRKISYMPPKGSVILTNRIADKLRVTAGDTIYISSPILEDDIPIAVSRVIEQNLGSGCYMELDALAALFDIPKTATAVLLNTDNLPYLKEYLKGGKNAATIDDKDSTLQKYRDMMGMYTSIYLFMEIMSALVAFAIIYNTATISLSERKREYATLRVVGLTIQEVCDIMNFEYWLLSAVAMILGVPFTLLLNSAMNGLMGDLDFTMPSTLPVSAYAVGVIGCVAAVMLSNYSAKRKISRFDMVEVLKERE